MADDGAVLFISNCFNTARFIRNRHADKSHHIHALSLHDALPISGDCRFDAYVMRATCRKSSSTGVSRPKKETRDRKSTRLNSSHLGISYAVFCLKKKKAGPPPRPTDHDDVVDDAARPQQAHKRRD